MRMMGRFKTPGCCPGTRAGRKPGPDCSGGENVMARHQRKIEKRAWKEEAKDAELAAQLER
jgi:hypothetical protein